LADETVRRGTLAKPRGVLVYGRAVNSGRSRALGYVVGKQDFAAIAKDRGQTLDESADIDLDRGGFVDGNCLDGKAVEKRPLVAVLVEDGSIERDCLPFLLEAEGWARQGSYPVKNNAIGECPEGRSMWIKGFLTMQKVEDEILLIILDLHPWYGPALREAAEREGVDLLALDDRAARDGIAAWHDPALWHRSKQEVTPVAAPMYGELVARLLAAQQGRSAKCLVLDLDNTLWGGVVGDDGVEGVVIGQGSALGEAESELRHGLRIAPADYRVLGSLARLEASRHQWRRAIEAGESALGHVLDPATLGVVGDAYAAMGDTSQDGEYYRTMEVAVLHQPGPFHRAWSLFLLDHNRDVPRVLEKVREEIQVRRDIYGYDLLAWALHQSDDDRAAWEPMMRALSLGTRDATLFYHAGMIARGLGQNALGREYLQAALKVNRYWDPFQPDVARAGGMTEIRRIAALTSALTVSLLGHERAVVCGRFEDCVHSRQRRKAADLFDLARGRRSAANFKKRDGDRELPLVSRWEDNCVRCTRCGNQRAEGPA